MCYFYKSEIFAKIGRFIFISCKNCLFFEFFMLKSTINICDKKKSSIFATQIGFGLWCNGNTTDSGPVIQGSSPCSPTKKERLISQSFFLCC